MALPLPAHPFARAPGKPDERRHQRDDGKYITVKGMLGH